MDSLLPSVPCNLSSVGMKLGCSHLIYHLQKCDHIMTDHAIGDMKGV